MKKNFLFFLLIFFLSTRCTYATRMLIGEKKVIFETKDRVKIVGSLFYPYTMLKKKKIHYALTNEVTENLGLNRLIYEYLLENDIPVSRVYKIEIKDGDFEYIRNTNYYNFNVDDSIDKERYLHYKKYFKEKDDYIIFKKKYTDFVGKLLTPKYDLEEDFNYEYSFYLFKDNIKNIRYWEKPDKRILAYILDIKDEKKYKNINPFLRESCFYDFLLKLKKKKKYPAVILIHMWKRNRHEWNCIVPRLQEEGFVVLSFDLRGHGESIYKKGRRINVKNFVSENYRKMVYDAYSAYMFLIGKKFVDPKNISIMGASLGSIVSIKLCEKVNREMPSKPVRAVVILSPARNFFAVNVERSIENCKKTAFLFVMDKKDPTPKHNDIYKSGCYLYRIFKGKKKAVIYNGAGHGTKMLITRRELMNIIVDWIKSNLTQE